MPENTELHNITGIEFMRTGTWNGTSFTDKDLQAIVDSQGLDKIGFVPPAKLGHNDKQEKTEGLFSGDGQPAFGWVDKIYKKGASLFLDLKDVPKQLFEAIQQRRYKNVSAEIYFDYKLGDKVFPRVLRAISILGADIPAVKGLKPLDQSLSLNNDGFTFETVKAFTVTAEPEKVDVVTPIPHREEVIYMTEEEVLKMQREHDAEVKKLQDEKDANVARADKAEADSKAFADQVQAQKDAAKQSEVKAFADKLETEGKVVAASKELVVSLLSSCSTDSKVHTFSEDGKTKELSQFDTAVKLFSGLGSIIKFGEIANTGKETINVDGENPGDTVEKRIKAFREKNSEATYQVAYTAVLSADPKLKEAYAATA